MTVTDLDTAEAVCRDLGSVLGRAASLDYSTLSVPELLALQSERERWTCAAAAVDHHIQAALAAQTTAKDIGAKNWADAMRTRDRLSLEESRRRVRHAELLGPRWSLTGEPLPPLRPHVAAAVAEGAINGDHVDVIESFFTKLPTWADLTTLDECEQALVAAARNLTPEALRSVVRRKLYELDQDGPPPDDREPDCARDRALVLSKQRPDGSSELRGRLTPTARATYEALMVKYAAPGMCNPADPVPCTSGTPTQEQIDNDRRTLAQRQHDAWETIGLLLLLSGDLGERNGFPVTIVATCTLEQLEDRAGVAVTHTGSTLPVKDLLNLAARTGASCYLTVFDNHGDVPLYLGRARRTATTGQRLALFTRDLGCTRPDCTVPAAGCQAHHIPGWTRDGQTDVTTMALACGGDNRLEDTTGWTTTMKNGRPHWTPPPLLDTGQPRTNQYWHPQLYPTEGDGGESDSPTN